MKRPKIFYGWWVVLACSTTGLLSGGLVILSFTAFFEPIANEFGWSYAQISLASSLRGVESGILAPLLGLLIDRVGPRKLLFIGVSFLGIGLIVLSRTSSLLMFYGSFALVAVGTSGVSPTVTMTAVANWFRTRLGLAIGLMTSGFAIGSLLVPFVVRLIDAYGWHNAAFFLGLGILIIGLPLTLIVRHKPEQYGYLPDGEAGAVAAAGEILTSARNGEVDVTVKAAVKSRTFWHLAVALVTPFIGISAVQVHIMPAMSTVGISRSIAGLVATGVILMSIIGRLGVGWLGDRLEKKTVSSGCLALMCTGLIILNFASGQLTWLIPFFVLLFAVGYGGNATIRVGLIRNYFGRKNFGTILGFIMGMISLGNIVGPVFAGWVFDNWRSYQWAWLTLAGVVLVGVFVMATTPPMRYK